MPARIEIRESIDGQWYWVLVGANHQDMCTSETFSRKRNAQRAADRARALMCELASGDRRQRWTDGAAAAGGQP